MCMCAVYRVPKFYLVDAVCAHIVHCGVYIFDYFCRVDNTFVYFVQRPLCRTMSIKFMTRAGNVILCF